jgi:hypothetical protein
MPVKGETFLIPRVLSREDGPRDPVAEPVRGGKTGKISDGIFEARVLPVDDPHDPVRADEDMVGKQISVTEDGSPA